MDRPTSERPPFLFVVGCERSGTTMFRSMLDASSSIAMPPESHFIISMATRHEMNTTPFAVERFLNLLFEHHRFRLWPLDPDAVRTAMAAEPPADYPEAIRRLYACYASAHGKARYGDKTPKYLRDLRPLAKLFPEARFVHLLRDGRDVASALLAADWGPRRLSEGALHWQAVVEPGWNAGRALGPARYLEVKYEDLVADPAPVLHRVCAFADIAFDEAMLHPEERAEQVLSSFWKEASHTALRLPVTKGLRDWRRDLADDDVALVEALIGGTLSTGGYERRFPSPTPAVKRRALRERLIVQTSVTSRRIWAGGRSRLKAARRRA
jgi:hypothetical protein